MADDVVVTFDEEMASLDKPQQTEYQPLYKMVSNNKIAISKKEGTLWYQRLQFAKKQMDQLSQEWEQNVQTYMGCQKPRGDNDHKSLRMNERDFDYENLVWSNTNAINRETIMKLPHIELTPKDQMSEPYVTVCEDAINRYLGQIGNNGINLKEKLKKADIGAQLTNRGIIRLDWNDVIDGDAVKREISEIEQKLAEPNLKVETVKKLEGELFSLNEKLEESGMSGMQLTLVDPRNLFIDPNAQLETGLDADWMIERRTELKSIIEAKYGTQEGTVYAGDKSDVGSDSTEQISDYVVGEDDKSEMERNKDCQTVTTYYIWDKLKKRVYLYEEGKWDYPLWVWDDPYGLIQFFPYFVLSYNLDPYSNKGLAECSYYLPIQNQINDINSKLKQARDRAFNVTIVDESARLDDKDLQNFTNGKAGYIKMRVPEGKRLADVLSPAPTPGLEQPLMDKSGLYAVMQKMSSSDPTMRGEEYRTNTTNMAIQQYGGAKKIIIGVRIDNLIAYYIRIAKETLKLMLDKFNVSDWGKLLGEKDAQFLVENPVSYDMLKFQWAGDDTVEPTSAMKKQEAVQLAQIMGQFAGATPAITIVMLKLMSRAFNEIVITPQDWEMVFQGINQQQAPQPGPMNIPNEQIPPVDQQPVPSEELINQAAMEG